MNEEEKLKQIIIQVGGDYEYIKAHPKEKLLGRNIGLWARDLLIIYFEIKKELNINIPKNMIINGDFDTYEGIRKIVIDN
mgnify:FL=1